MSPKSEISKTELQEVAERIRSLRQKATEHAIEIGRELLRVKASMPHGVFVKWVEKECQFKIRTAQDLMKLAREVETNAPVAALMVPSTLRVYLSKSTPSAVREVVRTRLENGGQVSRNELHSAIAEARAKRAENNPATPNAGHRKGAVFDLLTAGDAGSESEIDRSRKVAERLILRLSREDYEYVMAGMNWGVWNRVLVWLRAARKTTPERVEAAQIANGVGSTAAPAA